MADRRTLAVTIVLTVCSLVLLSLTDIPLGVAGEWEWLRIAPGTDEFYQAVAGGITAAVGGLLYLTLVWLGAKRLPGASRVETGAWMCILAAGGFTWLFAVQQSPTHDYRLQKSAFVLYYRGSSGYFYEARHETRSAAEFLSQYEDKMREGDVLHIGTHPPGLFLLHRGLIAVVASYPGLVGFLNQTQPREVEQMFDEIERRESLLPRDRAALWLAALLTQLAGVGTILPLYLLLREDYPRTTSWLAAALWPLVPALAVFLPKSDALYPLIGMLFLLCWQRSIGRDSATYGALAGLCLWCGLFLSLALLPVAAMAALWMGWRVVAGAGVTPVAGGKLPLRPILGLALGFMGAVLLLWGIFQFNSFLVWWINFQNHAGFYDQYARTYWKWLIVNVLELALGLGAPVSVLLVAAYARLRAKGCTWRSSLHRTFHLLWCHLDSAVVVGQEHGRSCPTVACADALGDLAGCRLLFIGRSKLFWRLA